jgi:transcriptional regulator with XRE-family HTH domain
MGRGHGGTAGRRHAGGDAVSGDQDAGGPRIARARRRRGLSQSVLAGLVGRSESWLSQVERGKRGVDSYVVLTRMAEALRVEVEELTGPGGGDGEEGQRVYEPAAEIERAMMGYEAVSASIGGRQPGASATTAHLRARAAAAYAGYQATRYDDTGQMLPALIRETEAAGGDDREACSVRALVYDTAAALLHRVGETSLAWTAADRALAAAGQSGCPELVALQAYRLSYVIAGRRHPAEALELAMSASAGLERVMRDPDADTLSVYGALHLAGVHAAAAVYDRAMSATLLARAREIASRTGDGNWCGVNAVLGNLRRCSSTRSRSAPGRVAGACRPLAAALTARRPWAARSRAVSKAARAPSKFPAARALAASSAACAMASTFPAASVVTAESGPGSVPASAF